MSNDTQTAWSEILDERHGQLMPMSFMKFIQNYRAFKVPSYQRPYSWGKREVVQYLNDIVRAKNNHASWYMGMVYIRIKPQRNPNDNIAEILDGQQRITTLFLLLIALREKVWKGRAQIQSEYARVVSVISRMYGSGGTKYSCRLHLTKEWQKFLTEPALLKLLEKPADIAGKEDWDPVFTKIKALGLKQLRGPGAVSVEAAIENLEILRKELRSVADDELPELVDCLDEKIWLVQSPLTSNVKSKLLFEGINSRGKNLELLDKLRFRMLSDECWSVGRSNQDYNLKSLESDWGLIFAELQRLRSATHKKWEEEDHFELFIRGKVLGGGPTNMRDHDAWIELVEKEINDENGLNSRLLQKWMFEFIHFLRVWGCVIEGKSGATDLGPVVDADQVVPDEESVRMRWLVLEALAVSENYKWFAAVVLREFAQGEVGKYENLWQRLVYGVGVLYLEVFVRDLKPNFFRDKMFEAGGEKDGEIVMSPVEAIKPARGLGLNNRDARFMLLLCSYLSGEDWSQLGTVIRWPRKGRVKDKEPDVDHFAPSSWSLMWSHIEPSSTVDSLRESLANLTLGNCNVELVQGWFTAVPLEDVQLKKDKSAPESSVINWLGNKWVVDHASNLKKSNRDHDVGLSLYEGRVNPAKSTKGYQGFVHPAHDVKRVGWGILKAKDSNKVLLPWDGARIVKRTFDIHETILNGLSSLSVATSSEED